MTGEHMTEPPAEQASGIQVPAGWYPDPGGSGLRYWDGLRWTENVTQSPPPAPRSNGFAIASLVAGIAGFLFGVGWIFALVFGYVALSQIKRSAGAEKGHGMALAGVILGWAWLALFVIVGAVAVAWAWTGTGA